MSTSIGIAIYPDHTDTPDLLNRIDDMAMHEAKQQGKNRCCCALTETNTHKPAATVTPLSQDQ